MPGVSLKKYLSMPFCIKILDQPLSGVGVVTMKIVTTTTTEHKSIYIKAIIYKQIPIGIK